MPRALRGGAALHSLGYYRWPWQACVGLFWVLGLGTGTVLGTWSGYWDYSRYWVRILKTSERGNRAPAAPRSATGLQFTPSARVATRLPPGAAWTLRASWFCTASLSGQLRLSGWQTAPTWRPSCCTRRCSQGCACLSRRMEAAARWLAAARPPASIPRATLSQIGSASVACGARCC